MFSVDKITQAKYVKDNSTFLSYLIPIENFDDCLFGLKKEHKKAVHFVRATRILNEYSQIIEYSSDDGEPKGSSGMSVLNVMRGSNLINSGIIVVRYFGGKLLGVGGLVRAYSAAALEVINNSHLITFEKLQTITIQSPLNKIELAKYLARKLNIKSLKFDFMQNFAIIHIEANGDKIQDFINHFKEK
ncbi:YigZ family protein [Helicobacter sp. MIT 99-5507]|uniref:YigZ family protein n=1 Tax=Helicobacter sp. MIT 99-5507 TaxID=152489 RepID=UPI000E1EACE1|nr:YigZ family protein [Helicobacter sp. MIT 99-5507]RDU58522.1 hypothetical protein CQA42_01665 [Helicobacter sp. MIT 99-5507]